jgi:RNA polymerase sigma factor (sigma-70 family)
MARIDTVCSRIRSNKESVVGVVTAVAPETRSSTTARDKEFESLYERYVKDVYRYTLALLRNPADAEDVTQTTFMNAYRAFKRGEEPVTPHNWLIKIAHNACRTRYTRTARRPQEVPLEDKIDELVVPEQDLPDVQGVLKALGRLPFNQRAALVMRELEGRSYPEIAETLGVSVPAVETLIFRARRSLRLKASALRALSAVQLPASLSSFFDGPGGAVAGGGALVGGGLIVKAAAALLAAGVVAGGIGYKTVEATTKPKGAIEHRLQSAGLLSVTPFGAVKSLTARPVAAAKSAARGSAEAAARDPRANRFVHRVGDEGASSGSGAFAGVGRATSGGDAAASGGHSSGASSGTSAGGTAVSTVASVTAAVPKLPTPSVPKVSPPPVSPPPVAPPAVPPPPVPVPSVTAPSVTVPSPPPPPPLP